MLVRGGAQPIPSTLSEVHPCSARPSCERSPDVRVITRGKLPPGLPWERERITLCNDHASQLVMLAGSSFPLSIRQLSTS